MRTIEVMPSTRRPARSRPAIRVRPVPRCDPPYDDEADGAFWGLTLPPATDSSRPAPAALAPTALMAGPTALMAAPMAFPAAATALMERPREAAGPPPVVAGPSAEARQAVRRFVAVLVEVLNGYRPPAHLRPLCRPVEAAEIITHTRAAIHRIAEARRALTAASRTGPRPTHPAPHRAADRHGRRPDPAAVLRLRLCEPRPGSVEATVLLVTAARTWALALRLDGGPDTWAASVAPLL